ncbi:28S ribosomal protein S16: mitochondrial-like protein [Dinothrombium tinctorium]|uniref:Small ribosomal subunit protein bS16m n=1 Tax=Dinothrombium tinctorium TaxID=1965070 RepID=A0A443QFQ7_9ACAR|nr:28S ribosomal protein S16: mitochondrial-like protein [Dinothrombium tinctorium]
MGRRIPFWRTGFHLRLVQMGCTNRPFYHIAAIPRKKLIGRVPDEVIGCFDPMPNERDEKIVAVDLERLAFWLGKGATPSSGVYRLLGLMGFLPVHPQTYAEAWKLRLQKLEKPKQSENDSSE